MNKKSIKKSLKKHKYSVLSISFLVIIIIMMLSNTNQVVASDNYSNYLYNQELNINNDRAMILNEKADNSNNYRNYFDSGFIFPAKLSNQMFNAITTDYTQYSLNQIYLDNLDNDFTFKSNDNSENLVEQTNLNYNDIIYNNGSYKGNSTSTSFTIVPNSDIISNWNAGSGPPHYARVNQYPAMDQVDSIVADGWDDGLIEQFGLTDITTNILIQSIELDFYYITNNEHSNNVRVNFYDGSEWLIEKTISLTLDQQYHWKQTTWTDLELSMSQINNLELRLIAPTSMLGGSAYLTITSIGVNVAYSYDNISVIRAKGKGIPGQFIAEYTFTDESGNNPIDWNVDEPPNTNIEVVSIENNHKDVIELYDNTGADDCYVSETFSETIGTIEFWFSTSHINKESNFHITHSGGNAIWLRFESTGQIKSYDGVVGHNLQSYSANTWYHFRIEFNSNTDKFDIYIDNILKVNQYSYYNSGSNLISFKLRTDISTSGFYSYLDAVDYSWSTGYYLNRNTFDANSYLNIEIEVNIDYMISNTYTTVLYDLYNSILTNESVNLYYLIWNYDLSTYSYIPNMFTFNESGQYRYNKFKFRVISSNISNPFEVYLLDNYLNITYIKINELGYHDLSIKLNKQKDDTTDIGFSLFEILIFDNYFLYRYSEINDFAENYITNWFNISYSSIKTLEINLHIRYGLNTLDIEITNILVDIYIDSVNVLSFLEQDRKYFLGKHYKSEFNYTCNNRNYLNLTGVIGNYSYNCLKGIRTLSGINDLIYNRFFIVPLFQENIDISQRIVSQSTVIIANEPNPPKDAEYWTYDTFRSVPDSTTYTNVGNWSIEFVPVKVQSYEAKYYYFPEIINERNLGSWRFRIGSFKVSLNFIRDSICYIINLILLFFQYLMFLVVASISFIFMFLGCYIIAFLYNICVYWIYIGFIYVIWFLWILILALLEVLIWIWRNVVIPLGSWIWNVLIPIIMDWIIITIAFFLTILIYCLTLGQIDFNETYLFIYDILWLIIRELYKWFTVFMENIMYILIFIMLYVICLLYLYFRYLIARARGFDKKAQKYYYTLTFFFTPFRLIFDWIKELLDITPIA